MNEVERFRTERIEFRATWEEKRQLKKNMRQSGYGTLGNYLLKMGLQGFIVNIDFTEVRNSLGAVGSLRTEFNRIGNNINQIAKHVNESHEIDVMDFYLLEQEVNEMREQMQNFEKDVVKKYNKIIRKFNLKQS